MSPGILLVPLLWVAPAQAQAGPALTGAPASDAVITNAPPPFLPVARAQSKQGSQFVAVAAPTTPWVVAQLHIKLAPDDITPKQRSATSSWAAQLADAGRKNLPVGAVVEGRVTADSVVISWGVAASVADADVVVLKAVDAALRARSQKPPSASGATPLLALAPLQVVDDAISASGARVQFAGSGYGLPEEGSVVDAAAAKALGDAVTADRTAVVIVAADTGDALLVKLSKWVTAPLYKPQPTSTPPLPTTTSTVASPGTTSTSTLTWWIAPRSDAGLLVLAELLGGRPVRTLSAAGIAVDVKADDSAALAAAEQNALEQVRRIAAAPPPPEVVEAAVARVTTTRLQALTDPAKVAHALGQAALSPRPSRLEEEFIALSSTTPQTVSLSAAALSQGSIVITRTPGPDPAPTTPTTPTTAPPTTTLPPTSTKPTAPPK